MKFIIGTVRESLEWRGGLPYQQNSGGSMVNSFKLLENSKVSQY